MRATDVKVYAGNTGPFQHACIRYETTKSDMMGLIVGLVVAIIVLLILAIVVVVVVCLYRRRGSRNEQTATYSSVLKVSTVFVDHVER